MFKKLSIVVFTVVFLSISNAMNIFARDIIRNVMSVDRNEEGKLKIVAKNVDIVKLLQEIASQAGLELILEPEIDVRVSFDSRDNYIPAVKILRVLVLRNGLGCKKLDDNSFDIFVLDKRSDDEIAASYKVPLSWVVVGLNKSSNREDFVSTVVNNGHVFAFGHYISPPYEIISTENTITINDIQYFPRLEMKTRSIPIKVTPKIEQKHSIFTFTRTKYDELISAKSKAEAEKGVAEFIQTHSLVKEVNWITDKNIEVIFIDGDKFNVSLIPFKGRYVKDYKPVENMAFKMAEKLTDYLQQNRTIAFGSGYRAILPHHEGINRYAQVEEVIKAMIPKSEKLLLLEELMGNPLVAKDILYNFGSN